MVQRAAQEIARLPRAALRREIARLLRYEAAALDPESALLRVSHEHFQHFLRGRGYTFHADDQFPGLLWAEPPGVPGDTEYERAKHRILVDEASWQRASRSGHVCGLRDRERKTEAAIVAELLAVVEGDWP